MDLQPRYDQTVVESGVYLMTNNKINLLNFINYFYKIQHYVTFTYYFQTKPEDVMKIFLDIQTGGDVDGLMKTMQNKSFVDSVFHFLF